MSFDGILAVKFVHKETDRDFCGIVHAICPLRTQHVALMLVFAHLLAQIHLFSDCYSLYVAADFNAK